MLLGMYGELMRQKIKVPADMTSALLLLHSYTLARLHVKRGDHLKAARMLTRVSNQISKFPARMYLLFPPEAHISDTVSKFIMQ